MRKRSTEPGLEMVWRVLENGDPDRALKILRAFEEDRAEVAVIRTLAQMQVGELGQAAESLERARALAKPSDESLITWTQAELLVQCWQPEPANALFRRLLAQAEDASLLERVSFCEELLGNYAEADRLYGRASELDPELMPPKPRFSDEEFQRVLAEAIARLPAAFRHAIERVEIVVEPMPSIDLLDASERAENSPELLGLFAGPSNLDTHDGDVVLLPPRIYLFKRNIERACLDDQELEYEIEVTLYHEIGHMLGLGEGELAAIGLE
jgi:predicted Zn-dependent protease with MMP-like domain